MLKNLHIIKTIYLSKAKCDELMFFKGIQKSTISFVNDDDNFHHFLDGELMSHKNIITNNIKSYKNMSFFKDFHTHLGELTVEFKYTDHNGLSFPKKLLGLVRGSNFRPDVRNSQQRFELESDYYTSQYLYYTLFI